MDNVYSDRQEIPIPLCRTNTHVSLGSILHPDRTLTSSGANRGREDTLTEVDIFATPDRSLKRTFGAVDLGEDEDENTEPGPSQRIHPSKRPHASNNQVIVTIFYDRQKLIECICSVVSSVRD